MSIPGYDAWKLRTPEEDYEMSGGRLCPFCGAYPVLRDLDRMQAEYRRTHKRGSARIIKAKRDAIHAALAGKAVR